MRIDILTLFPNMFDGFLNESIIKKSINKGIVKVNIINFRDYSLDPHKKVDDTPFGGGAGMVLTCQPIYDCIDEIKTKDSKVVLLTPAGDKFNQTLSVSFSKIKHLIIICGHYEGFDDRIRLLADYEVSIGDFVLTGGEIPAMAISDAIIRLLDGAITKDSLDSESFNDNLLDYPVYTKPRNFRGIKVPEVLLSGDHKKIEEYRKEERIRLTSLKRNDLLK